MRIGYFGAILLPMIATGCNQRPIQDERAKPRYDEVPYRWQIKNESAANPILLDSKTGRTWMLAPHDLAKGEKATGVSIGEKPITWARLPFSDPNDEPDTDEAANSN